MDNCIVNTVDRSAFDPTWTDRNGRRMGDPWGAAMGLFFDVAAFIFHETERCTPAKWEYRAGAGGEIDEMLPHRLAAMRDADLETLIHTGNVLHRYTRLLEKAGHSY
jgi:hypothetical protein